MKKEDGLSRGLNLFNEQKKEASQDVSDSGNDGHFPVNQFLDSEELKSGSEKQFPLNMNLGGGSEEKKSPQDEVFPVGTFLDNPGKHYKPNNFGAGGKKSPSIVCPETIT